MRMSERGSVLMELIVVFPIYLVVFGALFMFGNMLVKASRLPSADRTAAFDVQNTTANGWIGVLTKMFRPEREVTDSGAVTDLLERETTSEYYADTQVSGPFSLRSAVKVCNRYALSGGPARGQLAFADWFFRNSAQTRRVSVNMASLLSGERVRMYSKGDGPDRAYAYNYYTLKRVKYDAGAQYTWRDNRRPISDIVNARYGNSRWYREVYREKWHDEVNDGANAKSATSPLGRFAEYTRYPRFVGWSE